MPGLVEAILELRALRILHIEGRAGILALQGVAAQSQTAEQVRQLLLNGLAGLQPLTK